MIYFSDDNIKNTAYLNAIALVRRNPFYIQDVPIELIDERLLRLVRKYNSWAVDSWALGVSKSVKTITKNVFVDIIKRDYIDIPR